MYRKEKQKRGVPLSRENGNIFPNGLAILVLLGKSFIVYSNNYLLYKSIQLIINSVRNIQRQPSVERSKYVLSVQPGEIPMGDDHQDNSSILFYQPALSLCVLAISVSVPFWKKERKEWPPKGDDFAA